MNRSVLVDWMVGVHNLFSMKLDTLYLAVRILDRFIQGKENKIEKKEIQLVGVTAMLIAAKYEEIRLPEVGKRERESNINMMGRCLSF